MCAYEAAQQAIHEQEAMTLSPRDSRAFVEALLNPQAPNKHLHAAFADYKRSVADAGNSLKPRSGGEKTRPH